MSGAKHAPGAFCWAELTTTDAEGAKQFYTGLLGWQTEDDPIPGGGTYTMIRQDDGNVGGLYELNEQMRAAGVPPSWLAYVTVEDAAAAAAKARQLGGTVIKDALDVMEIGSMAVLGDPTGAVFAVWQPKTHGGAAFTDSRPGTVCWNELATRDAGKAGAFYTELFGWAPTVREMPTGTYTMLMLGQQMAGGMLQMTAEWGDLPSHWMLYFSVADCDACAAQAAALGGAVKVPPTDIEGVGRFSVIQDPQGAVFSVIKLAQADS